MRLCKCFEVNASVFLEFLWDCFFHDDYLLFRKIPSGSNRRLVDDSSDPAACGMMSKNSHHFRELLGMGCG